MKNFLVINFISFIQTITTILVLAYPLKSVWNNGVCKALTCASTIDYKQSSYLIGIILLPIIAYKIMEDIIQYEPTRRCKKSN